MAKIGQIGIGSYVPAHLKGEKKEDKKTSRTGASRFSSPGRQERGRAGNADDQFRGAAVP